MDKELIKLMLLLNRIIYCFMRYYKIDSNSIVLYRG